jgi:carboxypeptidase family protein
VYSRGKLVAGILFMISLLLAGNARAQYTTGTVQGTVLDPTGAAVSGATVTLLSKDTNAERAFTTSSGGIYIFAALPLGSYDLTVEAKGFAKTTSSITVTAAATLTENLSLQLATQANTVTVQALAASEFNTTDSQLAVTRSEQELYNLPVNGLDLTTLFDLEPGVQPMYSPGRETLVKVSGAQTGLITANGGRPESSNVEIDFTDANDWEFGGIAVGAAPVPDFVQELNIITSNPPAEYGIHSNGEIGFVTRSGTNAWHGDLYDYIKNDYFNARDYYDTTGKATRIDGNNYGFSTGGALIENKTFLFGGWERDKTLGGGYTDVALVPSQSARETVTDPIISNLISTYLPEPTGPDPSDPTNTQIGSVNAQFASPSTSYQFLVRGDQVFSSKHTLSIRYFQATGTSILTFAAFNTLSGFDSNLHNEERSPNITDTYSFSPNTINQLRVGYSRSIATLPPENGLETPRFTVAGLVGFGALPYFPQGRTFNIYQVNDVLSHAAGKHLLKFGFDYRKLQDNSQNATNSRGSFTFPDLTSFLAGDLSNWSQQFGPTALGFRSNLFSLFAQDDFKIRPTLTINLGVRWEYQGALREAHGLISVLDPTLTGSIGDAGTGALGAFRIGNPVINSNPGNVAPRIGFAWNPSGKNLVVRGGYGIYWDSFTFSPLASARSNPPLNYSFALNGTTSFQGANNFDALYNGTAPIIVDAQQQLGSYGDLTNFGSLTTVNRNASNAYSQQYNLTLEYRIAQSTVVSAGYVGSKGTNLADVIPINSVVNGPAPATSVADQTARLAEFQAAFADENGPGNIRLDPRFDQVNLVTDLANSNYNALQLNLRHTLKYGLLLQASYTWSKSIDDSSSLNPTQDANDNGFPQNANDLRAERAVSNFDVPNRIVVTGVWNVPFFQSRSDLASTLLLKGWSIQAIGSWQSGVPGTILSGPVLGISDVNLDGNFIPNGDDNTRANFNPSGSPFALNNAAAIAAQTQYTQPLLGNDGTAGRDTVRLKNLVDFDWAFQKGFQLRESGPLGSGPWNLQFRAELFNAFNNPYLSPAGDNWRTVGSAGFGLLNSAGPSRNLQLALRLVW